MKRREFGSKNKRQKTAAPSAMTRPPRALRLAVFAVAVLAAGCRSAAPRDAPARATAAGPEPADRTAGRNVAAPREVFENTIRWVTASELENFGYDVYRSENEDGPFTRITPEIIEGAGTTDEPQHYEYVDTTIDPHKTYYYYVESISLAGKREKFTPVAKVPPKIQGSSKPEAGSASRKPTG